MLPNGDIEQLNVGIDIDCIDRRGRGLGWEVWLRKGGISGQIESPAAESKRLVELGRGVVVPRQPEQQSNRA